MKLWKALGLAGIAGVAATGVAVGRSERRRRSYEPDDVRARLHRRYQQALDAEVPAPGWPIPAEVERRPDAPTVGSAAQAVLPGPGDLMSGQELTLHDAAELTRTGDLWLFRGGSLADRAIRVATNSPVNHVGMAVVVEDLPALLWHAELGRSLPDVWTGGHHRGVQLHDLRSAVMTWAHRYRQRVWLRQFHGEITPTMEDALLLEMARKDGTPFPATLGLVGRWLKGRARRPAPLETTYCAEVVASSYQAMGFLPTDRPANWYDPGRFWSGDRLRLERGGSLGDEIPVVVPPRV